MVVDKNTKLDREHGWSPGIIIDAEEGHRLKIWLISHVCLDERQLGFEIKQSATSGIGTNTVIRCSCGEGEDVTNYGAW
jgi:hypothetical protein